MLWNVYWIGVLATFALALGCAVFLYGALMQMGLLKLEEMKNWRFSLFFLCALLAVSWPVFVVAVVLACITLLCIAAYKNADAEHLRAVDGYDKPYLGEEKKT